MAVASATASDGAVEGRTVEVRVPATSANLGPGFDTLGLAFSVYDTLLVTALPAGRLEIEVTGSGASEIPRDESNLIVRTIAYVFADAGRPVPGLRIVAENAVPHGGHLRRRRRRRSARREGPARGRCRDRRHES